MTDGGKGVPPKGKTSPGGMKKPNMSAASASNNLGLSPLMPLQVGSTAGAGSKWEGM